MKVTNQESAENLKEMIKKGFIMKLKLFRIDYMDDCDNESCLMVGTSKEDVSKRFEDEIFSKLPCPMFYFVYEIDMIDGHKILVE